MAIYLVRGQHRETRARVSVEIEAPDAAAARVEANTRGIIIDDCVPKHVSDNSPDQPDLVWERREHEYASILDSLHYRAMKRAAFLGALLALVLFAVCQFILGAVYLFFGAVPALVVFAALLLIFGAILVPIRR